jgi:hypothetical protein
MLELWLVLDPSWLLEPLPVVEPSPSFAPVPVVEASPVSAEVRVVGIGRPLESTQIPRAPHMPPTGAQSAFVVQLSQLVPVDFRSVVIAHASAWSETKPESKAIVRLVIVNSVR